MFSLSSYAYQGGMIEICNNGMDDDGDSLADCDDDDCFNLNSNVCIPCLGDGISFADIIIEYTPNCENDLVSNFSDPTEALGMPNYISNPSNTGTGAVSLGHGGSMIVEFSDNLLTNSGTIDPDFWVFEIGPAVEACFLEIRAQNVFTVEALENQGLVDTDGDGFYPIGGIGGSTSFVDLDAIIPGFPQGQLIFDTIKIIDDINDNGGNCAGTAGADIDAVCALSSINNLPEICNNGIDDDGDGLTDCEDDDCFVFNAEVCIPCLGDGISFADEVIDYSPTCEDELAVFANDPIEALGETNYVQPLPGETWGRNFVSLGYGGNMTLGFTDNLLINSGDTQSDLWVFEVGIKIEPMAINLRPANTETKNLISNAGIMDQDNDGFYEFGSIGGATSSLDIDAMLPMLSFDAVQFDAVQIIDLNPNGFCFQSAGADIDAICALSSRPAEICDNGIDDDGDGDIDCDDSDIAMDCCCVDPVAVELPPEVSICAGESYEIILNDSFQSYIWSTGETTATITVNSSDNYAVTVLDECDNESNAEIFIDVNPNGVFPITANICEGEIYVFGNEELSVAGSYTQTYIAASGCDSVVVLDLSVLPEEEVIIQESICEGSFITINGISYDESGEYQQLLTTTAGCDSILSISIESFPAYFVEQNFTIIEGQSIVVNGQEYDSIGVFVQNYTTTQGCDSIIAIQINQSEEMIHYSLDDCFSYVNDGADVYDEFVPAYPEELVCDGISGSIMYRVNPMVNKHSCTPGVDGSKAICVSSVDACEYIVADDKSINIDLSLTEGIIKPRALTNISFYEKAPLMFDWIDGASGPNNFPTRYGMRILLDGNEVYRVEDVPTSPDWTFQIYDLQEADIIVTGDNKINIQLLAYCTIDNGSEVNAWDVDEIKIYGRCLPEANSDTRIVAGSVLAIDDLNLPAFKVQLQTDDYTFEKYTNDTDFYAFPSMIASSDITITAQSNQEVMRGVTTLDLLHIQKHILGINTFNSNEKLIAADINNSGSISALDVLELRKIILGINDQFPDDRSWVGIHPSTALGPENCENIMIEASIEHSLSNNFMAVKIGDVDQSYQLYNDDHLTSRSEQNAILHATFDETTEDKVISFFLEQDMFVEGVQLSLELGDMSKDIIHVTSGAMLLSDDDYHISKKGNLIISKVYDDAHAFGEEALFQVHMTKDVFRSNAISLSAEFRHELYAANTLETISLSLESPTDHALESDTIEDYAIFPNPSTGVISIEGLDDKAIESIHVTDIQGRVILQKRNIANDQNTLDLSTFDRGVYFISIENGQKVHTKRVVLLK